MLQQRSTSVQAKRLLLGTGSRKPVLFTVAGHLTPDAGTLPHPAICKTAISLKPGCFAEGCGLTVLEPNFSWQSECPQNVT